MSGIPLVRASNTVGGAEYVMAAERQTSLAHNRERLVVHAFPRPLEGSADVVWLEATHATVGGWQTSSQLAWALLTQEKERNGAENRLRDAVQRGLILAKDRPVTREFLFAYPRPAGFLGAFGQLLDQRGSRVGGQLLPEQGIRLQLVAAGTKWVTKLQPVAYTGVAPYRSLVAIPPAEDPNRQVLCTLGARVRDQPPPIESWDNRAAVHYLWTPSELA